VQQAVMSEAPAARRLTRGRTPGTPARRETIAGAALLAASAVGAALVTWRPGASPLDKWGFSVLTASYHSVFLLRVTDIGTLPVLLAVSVVAGLLGVRRDVLRAVACAAGPLAAAALADYVTKPLVARYYVGVLTYPSGSVAVIAAVSTAMALAVRGPLRVAVAAVGTVATGLMVVAVVALRWHYLSDALAGAAIAVGTVLLIDGALHLAALRRRRASS
jgi:membrane-associated phospholipid phosphatase